MDKTVVGLFGLLLPAAGCAGREALDVYIAPAGVEISHNTMASHAPEKLRELAFLIGEWSLESTTRMADGSIQIHPGWMSARFGMAGFAVETVSVHPPFGPEDFGHFAGTQIFTIHPETSKIAGVSINSLGNRKTLEGDTFSGEVVTTASGEMFGGGDFMNRTTYFNITADRFETKLEVSSDGGQTWYNNGYTLVASRRTKADRPRFFNGSITFIPAP